MNSEATRPRRAAIPAIDLRRFLDGDSSDRAATARRVDAICRSIGFLVITDHGVPKNTVERAWQAAREFFDLPLERKLAARAAAAGNPRGYFPLESETLAKTLDVDTPPDVKESFSCGPMTVPAAGASIENFDFFYGANIWPGEPAGFRAAWTAYYEAMEELGENVMRLFAAALDLEPDYFASSHCHHVSALRAINYPGGDGKLANGQRAAGEHSDYGSVTILKPDPRVPGLEIRMPSGDWRAAPRIDDGFVVNIGDMLARWTNDRWVSTLHRVALPDAGRRRQSIAYFQNPNHDAEIHCIPTCLPADGPPRYPPELAGRYLMRKFMSAQ